MASFLLLSENGQQVRIGQGDREIQIGAEVFSCAGGLCLEIARNALTFLHPFFPSSLARLVFSYLEPKEEAAQTLIIPAGEMVQTGWFGQVAWIPSWPVTTKARVRYRPARLQFLDESTKEIWHFDLGTKTWESSSSSSVYAKTLKKSIVRAIELPVPGTGYVVCNGSGLVNDKLEFSYRKVALCSRPGLTVAREMGYAFGGFGESGVSKLSIAFARGDLTRWDLLAEHLPVPMACPQTAVLGDTIFVFGTANANKIHAFSTLSKKWEGHITVPETFIASSHATLVAGEKSLFLIGPAMPDFTATIVLEWSHLWLWKPSCPSDRLPGHVLRSPFVFIVGKDLHILDHEGPERSWFRYNTLEASWSADEFPPIPHKPFIFLEQRSLLENGESW